MKSGGDSCPKKKRKGHNCNFPPPRILVLKGRCACKEEVPPTLSTSLWGFKLAWPSLCSPGSLKFYLSARSRGDKSAALVCGARAQNQATTHRQNCHKIAMFIFDKWKSKIKQNGYYSSFHFFYWIVCIFPHKTDFYCFLRETPTLIHTG